MGVEPVDGACGANFLMPFEPPLELIEDVANRCRIVECFYADPSPDVVDAAHRGGALAGWQVGSAAEARRAEEAGCDDVVAQGTEAGGDVRGDDPLDEVLAATLAAISFPVVAAGGIVTAHRVAELVRSGADAAASERDSFPAPSRARTPPTPSKSSRR